MHGVSFIINQLSHHTKNQIHSKNSGSRSSIVVSPLNGDPADIFPIPCSALPIPQVTKEDVNKQKKFTDDLKKLGLYQPVPKKADHDSLLANAIGMESISSFKR